MRPPFLLRWIARTLVLVLAAGLTAASLVSCEKPRGSVPPVARPNVLWVVWDTVRADHMGLHGYARPTTPWVDQWARGARVFDDCTSAAPTTTPSHASMFTGLLPSEHGANNNQRRLDERFTTLAELLSRAGYQTYLYSANPSISQVENFTQGFDVAEHPWDATHRDEALRILRTKSSPAGTPPPAQSIDERGLQWGLVSTGELAQRATLDFLKRHDPARPFFVFLNYMEAHQPYQPSETYRRRMMSPEEVTRSYQLDRSWPSIWAYNFGLKEYSPEELTITAATYDAAIAELDELFRNLLAALEAGGYLKNTVVVLTSDHGECLGEHHLLGHIHSVYEPLIRVPLIVLYPPRVQPGHESRPVSSMDLFPTLLELAGVAMPDDLDSKAVSLLTPHDDRMRLAEMPAISETPFRAVQKVYPNWDPSPWRRSLRALYSDRHKYIWSSDGQHELYDLDADAGEVHNLIGQAELAQRMVTDLAEYVGTLRLANQPRPKEGEVSKEHLERLAGLGYVDMPDKEDEPATSSAPSTSAPAKKSSE